MLHVIKLPKNTGTPGLPRNMGVQFARGKYITFLDSDDLFTNTALEELVTLAEKFQADVVHTNQFFRLWKGENKSPDDPAFTNFGELINPANFVMWYNYRFRPDKPIFMTENFAERVKIFLSGNLTREIHATLYRRDFLVTNQIFFPNMACFEDEPFTFQVMCSAKKFLRVPNISYIVRAREGSTLREQLDIGKEIHKNLRLYIDGFRVFEKIMDNIKFFGEHPDYRYAVLDWYFQGKIYRQANIYTQNHPAAINPLIVKEFHSDEAAFAAYLFNLVNLQRLQIAQLQAELSKFHKQ